MKNKIFLSAVVLSIVLGLGCTDTQTKPTLTIDQPLLAGEGIVILADAQNPRVNFSDRQVDECLGKWLRKNNSELRMIPAQEFRAQLYPYFSLGTLPQTAEEFQVVLNRPQIKARLMSMQVRFLVIQREAMTTQKGHGAIIPFAAPGAGGLIGLAWWNRQTAFTAQIWDLKTGAAKGEIQMQAQGTGIMPALILPIPLYLPATEKASCKAFAKHLSDALYLKKR